MLNCKICGDKSHKIFEAEILRKYSVSYHKCQNCEFIQTDEPFWLGEAYSSAITSQDIGLISRNLIFSPLVENIIYCFFDYNGKFLDYGGGYGMFVRLMRDRGILYKRYDTYCDNLFARGFDYIEGEKFELITAIEVFEHLVDPLIEIENMLKISNSILFTTEIQPKDFTDQSKWWYVMPETGQHISLYSIKTLHIIAQKYNLNFYTNGSSFHLLTNKKINSVYFKVLTNKYISKIIGILIRKRPSLLWKDYLKSTEL